MIEKMTHSYLWIQKLGALMALVVAAQTGHANVIGSDTQNFVPTTSGLDFVSVHSSETLSPGYWNLGLFANHAYNTLPFSAEDGGVRDQITGLDFSVGYGVLKNLDVGLALPYIAAQRISGNGARGQFDSTGFTEARLNTKFRFFGNRRSGLAAVLSYNENLMENNPYIGLNGGPSYSAELVADTTYHGFAFGANLGYRVRNPGSPLPGFDQIASPQDDQYVYSGAVSTYLDRIDSKLIWEIYGSQPVAAPEEQTSRQQSTAETIAGIKHQWSHELALHTGAGTELKEGTSSADLRVYLGLNYGFAPPKQPKAHIVKKPKKKPKKIKKKPFSKKPLPTPMAPPIAIPAPPKVEPIAPFPQEKSAPAEPNLGGDEVIVLRDIHFYFDSDLQVLSGAKSTLKKLAQYIKAIQVEKVIIEGHTDSVGSDAYNNGLAMRRALTVLRYLTKVERIPQNLLQVKGYGERYPVADNGNYQGRQLNRRVVFRLFYKNGAQSK